MTKKKRKKPEKLKNYQSHFQLGVNLSSNAGYNQACDWEKRLPSEEEISQLIRDTRVREGYLARDVCDVLAKAIHRRIRGE